ncbi:sialin-like [Phlebotomus argentipes]|uniref:sialin-like n=1 Tax=Phlebotomus argentipes TaxID=94469 RepID=UPI00289343C9|nr:sialin-like [Phlebotomus argentipes]
MVQAVAAKALAQTLGKLPVRLNVAVMLFFSCMISYMYRVNFSITVLAMVNPINANASAPDYGPRYDWDKQQQGLLLGAYFWGYLISGLPGIVLIERFGGKIVTTISMALSVIVTAMGPLFAAWGFYSMYANRFITGFLAGPVYPALHNLVAKWAPPDEKGKFISTIMGGTFGTVITFPMVGVLIENLGWSFGFYVPAIIGFTLCIMWHLIVADGPSEHSWISPKEQDYIERSLGMTVAKKKPPVPLLKIMTSIPFLSLVILHFGGTWGLFFLMTAAPTFMSEVLNFKVAKAGFLSALPYLARLICGIIFGQIGDIVAKRGWLTVTSIRKLFTIFSHIFPGIFLIILCFVSEPYVSVAIISISLSFNGAACITNLQNSHDLAPNFAGILYGIMNFFGTATGFLSPMVVAHFTQYGSTMKEWCYIFVTGSTIYIIPALLYMIFGSGVIQSWNEPVKSQAESGQEKAETELEKKP